MASIKVGAAWWKQDRNGQDYLSISLDPPCGLVIQAGQRAALFPNPNKTQQNQPDYELVILPTRQADMGEDDFSPEQQPRNTYAQPAPARQAAPPPEAYEAPPARAMAPRQAAPAPRPPAPPPAQQRPPAARPAQQRRPAPPPDEDLSDLEDPFAE